MLDDFTLWVQEDRVYFAEGLGWRH